MSKTTPPPDAIPAGITPLDPAKSDKPAGGVFRLETAGVEGGAPAAVKRRVSLPAIMFGCLVLGGAGLLYAMRLVGIGPLNSVAGLTKLNDYELARPGSMSEDHRRVLAQLSSATAAPAQVPVDQVQKNPFELSALLGPEPSKPDTSDNGAKASADRLRRDAEARKRRTETAFKELKLNGVLGGSRPVARISGEAVRVGDTVADIFTVAAIHGRGVDLTADGKTYTLAMDDDKQNARKK